MHPNRIVTKLNQLRAWEIGAFGAVAELFLLNTAVVYVAFLMMSNCVTFSAVASTTVTTLVNQSVDAGTTIKSAWSGKYLIR